MGGEKTESGLDRFIAIDPDSDNLAGVDPGAASDLLDVNFFWSRLVLPIINKSNLTNTQTRFACISYCW
jgi:hypothetical protein